MSKKFFGVFLIMLLLLCPARADQSKKVYELIYQDVQVLKQQILQLQEEIHNNIEDIKTIKKQLEEIPTQLNFLQSEQVSIKEDLNIIPARYQILLEKLEDLNLQLIKISGELLQIRRASLQPRPTQEEKSGKDQALEETKMDSVEGEEQTEEKPKLPPISLSPQEVYSMAYSDYLKGNFPLAIDGFEIYMEQFKESPLADNAQYWIGECYFSQKKFEEAIEEFNELILNYPQGDKIPTAYLKKGLGLLELGKEEEAISVFKLMISKYPLSEETKLAQQKIKELLPENERCQQP